jgi:hypothetical protein
MIGRYVLPDRKIPFCTPHFLKPCLNAALQPANLGVDLIVRSEFFRGREQRQDIRPFITEVVGWQIATMIEDFA